MGRVHGRHGRLYAGIASDTAAAELVAYNASWSIDFTTDKADATAQGDGNKVYVAGLPDSQGQFAGFYDDSSAQLYTAASDGLARKFYLYPSALVAGTYFFGTAFFDFSISSPVDGVTATSGSFAAATSVIKVTA